MIKRQLTISFFLNDQLAEVSTFGRLLYGPVSAGRQGRAAGRTAKTLEDVGVERVVAIRHAQEAGGLLEGLVAEARHFLQVVAARKAPLVSR